MQARLAKMQLKCCQLIFTKVAGIVGISSQFVENLASYEK